MTMAVSAVRELKTRQFDFSSAYLNGVLDRPLYMWQPKGFVKQGEEMKVCLMKRGLYGFVQSGHIWYNTLAKEYSSLGYRSSKADPCVRSRSTQTHTPLQPRTLTMYSLHPPMMMKPIESCLNLQRSGI